MFPDKAQLFVCAIEDRQYKEDKIYCRLLLLLLLFISSLRVDLAVYDHFSLNPVQFFGSVAFVFVLSSAFVSLFSLCTCYACYFFFIKNLSHVLMQALKLYFPVILFITDVHY